MARLVAPVVGAVIGFAIGGPVGAQVGWAAGSIAGALLFPETIRNVQPRLDDLKVTTGAYGQPIPYVEGSMRVGGWVAWASDRRPIDTTTTVDSKGGPKVENTTTTYEVDMLIILASHRIAGVRRIWADGELVWSRAAESDFATISASSTFARRVTVYTGDENQLPDPTYEAAVGVGNAPAYRERGSIFLEGLDLGQSGRIPNLTFEVYQAGVHSVFIEENTRIQAPTGAVFTAGSPAFALDGYYLHVGQWDNSYQNNIIRRYFIDADGVATPDREFEALVSAPFSRGNSDESCAVIQRTVGPTIYYDIYTGNGQVASCEAAEDLGSVRAIYSKYKSDFFIGGTFTGSRRIYRHSSAGGPQIQNVVLPEYIQSMWVVGDKLYAVPIGFSDDLYEITISTMSLSATIKRPSATTYCVCVPSDDGALYIINGNLLYRRLSGAWELVINGPLAQAAPQDSNNSSHGFFGGVLFSLNGAGTNFDVDRTHEVWVAYEKIALEQVPLGDAVSRLHERAGMSLSDVDVSALSGKTTRGFAVTQISTTRTAIEALMAAHFFQAVKDNGIRYVNRGGAPVATIPYDDLGATEAGSESPEPLEITEANDIEIPAYVAVKYANISDDYQEGLEYSDRLITRSTETRVVEFAMAMTPTEAKQLAQKIADDLQVSKARVSTLSLQRKYAALQPTDVVMVQGRDGLTVRVRLDKRDEADGVIKLEGVLDDASVVTGTATTDTDYGGSFSITLPSRTNWAELDIPLLRTADDGPSFEVAFGAAGSNWRGAVYFAGDDDSALQQVTAVSTETVTGSCLTALGAWSGGGGVQVTGFLDVQVDGELSSITYDQLMAGGNTAAISSSGRWEIIGFQYAELLSVTGSTRTYRLRNFLRYRRGTEGVTHAVGDRFVLMQTQGIRRIPMSLADLQRQRRYKAVSSGRSIDSAQSVAFSWTGEKLKPLSPSNVRGNRDTADLVITWARRTRHEDNWLLGSIPLGETTERYEVDILNGSTVVRTLSTTTQSVTYTAAQQTTDFGSPQAAISIRVYQLSDSIGRGYPAARTV